MLVKVCGLKDEKNINDVSNLDIDFMGLILITRSFNEPTWATYK